MSSIVVNNVYNCRYTTPSTFTPDWKQKLLTSFQEESIIFKAIWWNWLSISRNVMAAQLILKSNDPNSISRNSCRLQKKIVVGAGIFFYGKAVFLNSSFLGDCRTSHLFYVCWWSWFRNSRRIIFIDGIDHQTEEKETLYDHRLVFRHNWFFSQRDRILLFGMNNNSVKQSYSIRLLRKILRNYVEDGHARKISSFENNSNKLVKIDRFLSFAKIWFISHIVQVNDSSGNPQEIRRFRLQSSEKW
jgi:hypothetical protein